MTLLLALVLGPLSLFATWLVCGAAVAAIGMAVRALVLPGAPLTWRGLLACFWAGMATTVLILQLWHLVLPVDAAAAIPLFALGVAGVIRERHVLGAWWRAARWPSSLAALLLVVLLCWWVGGQGLGLVASYDTYMYHIPAVDWFRQHAIVPGLANLQERLGFNNASFLLAALLESGPWTESSPGTGSTRWRSTRPSRCRSRWACSGTGTSLPV